MTDDVKLMMWCGINDVPHLDALRIAQQHEGRSLGWVISQVRKGVKKNDAN